jgi:hypothetical protein
MVEHYRHLGRKDALRKMEQIRFGDLDANEQGHPGHHHYSLLRYFTIGVCIKPSNGGILESDEREQSSDCHSGLGHSGQYRCGTSD